MKYIGFRRDAIISKGVGSMMNRLSEGEREKIQRFIQKDSNSLNCADCNEQCSFRWKQERIPVFADGKGQCIRWHREADNNPYSWVNGDGTVIAIPEEIIDKLFDEIVEVFEKNGNGN